MTVQESTPHSSSRDRVRAYRARMREAGLRPVTYWLPDVKSPSFREQARLDSIAIRNSIHEKEDQAFIDSISLER